MHPDWVIIITLWCEYNNYAAVAGDDTEALRSLSKITEPVIGFAKVKLCSSYHKSHISNHHTVLPRHPQKYLIWTVQFGGLVGHVNCVPRWCPVKTTVENWRCWQVFLSLCHSLSAPASWIGQVFFFLTMLVGQTDLISRIINHTFSIVAHFR